MKTDIISKVLRDFEHKKALKVIEILNDYERKRGIDASRVIRCIVALADGDQNKISKYIELAEVDWRDVIVAAEQYPHQYNEPFPLK